MSSTRLFSVNKRPPKILYKLHGWLETNVAKKVTNRTSFGLIFKLQSKAEFKLRKFISWWRTKIDPDYRKLQEKK